MNKEYERELNNLVHELQQTARMAFQLDWTGSGCSDAAIMQHGGLVKRFLEFK